MYGIVSEWEYFDPEGYESARELEEARYQHEWEEAEREREEHYGRG